jgi:hypothetical protein
MHLGVSQRSGVVRSSAVLLLASALLAGCHGGSSGGRQARRASRQSGLEAAALAAFLPASHADLQAGLPVQNFYGAVAARLLTRCLQRHGFQLQYPDTPTSYNWSDANSLFPDLDRIASRGLLTPSDLRGERDWQPKIPAEQRAAFDAVFTGCRDGVSRTFRSANRFWIALQRKWADVDARGDADPKYLRLVSDFGACVRRRGYGGSTPSSFLLGVDRLVAQSRRSGKPISDQASISLRTGKVYAACYRAANAYRQKIRRRARTEFMDQHALEIQAAQRQLEATVRRLSRKMGVTYQAAGL